MYPKSNTFDSNTDSRYLKERETRVAMLGKDDM